MRNISSFILLIVLTSALQSCTGLLTSEKTPEYVTVKGTQFQLEGKPYYFVGTNFWYGCYLGSPGVTGNRERLIKELEFLKSIGVDNLRILGASEETVLKNSLSPAIQKEAGVYDEHLLEGLDFLLAEMAKRDMKAVIFLNNYWEWSGGMAQYNQWFGGREIPDPANSNHTWADFMNFSASFYINEKANSAYKNYIKDLVNRKNKFTGNYYFEDSAIMAWQLANEPRPGQLNEDPKDIDYFYRWVDSTAKFIHSIDPNHLVTTGNEGTMGSMGSEEFYLTAHASKYIDYVTFHLWAKNWGWFDAKKIDETYEISEKNALEYIKKHIDLARLLGKPTNMEEFGLARDFELFTEGTPTTARDKYYSKIFDLVYDSAAAGAPIAGTNFWAWGGEGRPQREDAIWKDGDPLTGDPGQEPQGLNSVFDTDTSTISIIHKHADQMKGLRKEIIEVADNK